MVVEYIRYTVPEQRHEAFEAAWAAAREHLDAAPECLSYEVAHGVEEPGCYIVRIEWSSVDEHEQGFRHSPGFSPFFAAVKPFFGQIEEMRHYAPTTVVSGR